MGTGRKPSILAPPKEGGRIKRKHPGLALANFKSFEFALMIQIAIDEFMYNREVLKKRGMF